MSEQAKSAYEQLNDRHKAFVDIYCSNGFKGAAAARTLEYAAPNVAAARLLANDNIRAAVAERMRAFAMSSEEALARIAAIARSDIGDIFRTVRVEVSGREASDDEGESVPTREVTAIDIKKAIDEGRSFLIKSYSTTQYGERVELYSALDALNSILRQYEKTTNINYNVDPTKLTDEQLTRLANGEDVLSVIRN